MNNFERPKTVLETAKETVRQVSAKIGDLALDGIEGIKNSVNPSTREERWSRLMENR